MPTVDLEEFISFDKYCYDPYTGRDIHLNNYKSTTGITPENTWESNKACYHYMIDSGLAVQVQFMDWLYENRDSDLRAGALMRYVINSKAIQEAAKDGKYHKDVELIDAIFEQIPELSGPLIVYRRDTDYTAPNFGDIYRRPKFTSASISFTHNQLSGGYDGYKIDPKTGKEARPIYSRIDLMPGMKIIPIFNYEKWATPKTTSAARFRSEFEVMLPRHARLYHPGFYIFGDSPIQEKKYDKIKTRGIKIYGTENPSGDRPILAPILNYFIVARGNTGVWTIKYESSPIVKTHKTVPFPKGGNGSIKKSFEYTVDSSKDIFSDDVELSEKLYNSMGFPDFSTKLLKMKVKKQIKSQQQGKTQVKTKAKTVKLNSLHKPKTRSTSSSRSATLKRRHVQKHNIKSKLNTIAEEEEVMTPAGEKIIEPY
jgi:hypothetical protein